MIFSFGSIEFHGYISNASIVIHEKQQKFCDISVPLKFYSNWSKSIFRIDDENSDYTLFYFLIFIFIHTFPKKKIIIVIFELEKNSRITKSRWERLTSTIFCCQSKLTANEIVGLTSFSEFITTSNRFTRNLDETKKKRIISIPGEYFA